MISDRLLIEIVRQIPFSIRRHIMDEGLIDKAFNAPVENTPMEYLHAVYVEFIDKTGEYSDFQCPRCREKILSDFKKFKPYMHYH